MKTLIDYSKTLDELLKGHEKEDSVAILPDMTPDREENNTDRRRCYVSPLAQHFRSFTSILECNLEDKSRLYKDESLGHLFLMNNIHYMAEKMKGNSNLRTILGDDWIRKHNWKFQHHAMSYERATWSSILSLLRDEGLQNPGSNSISRTLLKERLYNFNLAFEDVYKGRQDGLSQIVNFVKILDLSNIAQDYQAYRSFVGRHTYNISDKHIKYTADDLENFLLDLF
ncbi:hypothetical protein HAX54_039674 [Datura stramonium]|uniref:Exocyst subunit Exo70 family protein n=1 Tax=Datura stramonium TaxID=4076 RepID=A0ABS8SJG1_DATST|nr:hypothetical protein [Datura stramonium]